MITDTEKITNIRKDKTGNIIQVKTHKGNIYSISDAIEKIKNHQITGVSIDKDKDGKEILANNPTGLHYGPMDDVPNF